MVILSFFQYIEKLRSLYTSFFHASWHAPVVDSAAMRTVYVVTTAAGQSFEAIYEGTPLFLSIPGVNAITVLSAVPRLRQSLLSGCFAGGVQAALIDPFVITVGDKRSRFVEFARLRWRVLHTGVVRIFRAMPASTVDTFHKSLHGGIPRDFHIFST